MHIVLMLTAAAHFAFDAPAHAAVVEALQRQAILVGEDVAFDARPLRVDLREGPAPGARAADFESGEPELAAVLSRIPGFRRCIVDNGACEIAPGEVAVAFTRIMSIEAGQRLVGVMIAERGLAGDVSQRAYRIILTADPQPAVVAIRHAWSATMGETASSEQTGPWRHTEVAEARR